jgi:hypothetical protein
VAVSHTNDRLDCLTIVSAAVRGARAALYHSPYIFHFSIFHLLSGLLRSCRAISFTVFLPLILLAAESDEGRPVDAGEASGEEEVVPLGKKMGRSKKKTTR